MMKSSPAMEIVCRGWDAFAANWCIRPGLTAMFGGVKKRKPVFQRPSRLGSWPHSCATLAHPDMTLSAVQHFA